MSDLALKLVPPPAVRRLDLACGQRPREGFEGVDLLAPDAKHKIDLLKFPWPWEDSSVDELHSSHFIEHIPNREVEARDLTEGAADGDAHDFVGQDMLFAFFDECWRILKPEGVLTLIWPCSRSDRAFQDPTHRRYIPDATMPYLNAEWRKLNGLDHYRVRCDFAGRTNHTMPSDFALLHPEAQRRRFTESWNVIIDFHAQLIAKK